MRYLTGWILLAAMLPALAAEPDIEIVLSNQEYPPYMGKSLPRQGLLSAVVREAFLRGGVKVSYEFFPNNRTLQMARSGNVDGSLGWAPNPDRKKQLLYTDPVMSLGMVFVQRNETPISWRSLSDLSPYRIGITTGNFYSTEFEALQKSGDLEVDPANDDVTNLRKLLARHIDLFPIDREVGTYLLAQNFKPEQARQLLVQNKPFWTAPMHVVIWKKHPRAAELVQRFNRGLKLLRESGDMERTLTLLRLEINGRY